MTTLTDIIPTCGCGLGFEEPKREPRGWSLLDGKNAALGLDTGAKRNVSFQLGYYEEMADCAFVVERTRPS